ncbi:MAG: peroxiredoxin [Polyangiales bacterium]
MIGVGDVAPEIDLAASDGARFQLSARRGRVVVVYFFPKAFTPGCTRESLRFRDNAPDLAALGADVVGISTDDLSTACEFAAELKVTFPLLSDVGGAVARAWGVRWTILGLARRVTFVVGRDGKVEAVFRHEIQVNRHLDDVLAFIRKKGSGGATE